MTLSEFKGWFAEQVLSFHRDPGNTRALGIISSSLVSAFMIEAEKKLASVEDDKRIKCEDCDEPLYPVPGTAKCVACYETCMAMKEAANVLRGTKELQPDNSVCIVCKHMGWQAGDLCSCECHIKASPRWRSDVDKIATELCHYCKEPLVFIMTPDAGVNPQVPQVGVCSVCHLYQP